MSVKAHICNTCLFHRAIPLPNPGGTVECHVRSVQDWPIREPDEDCGECKFKTLEAAGLTIVEAGEVEVMMAELAEHNESYTGAVSMLECPAHKDYYDPKHGCAQCHKVELEKVKGELERLIKSPVTGLPGVAKEMLDYDPDNFHPPGSYGYVSGVHPEGTGPIWPTQELAYIEALTTERDRMREALDKKDKAIALLNSMVRGGEDHSPTSEAIVSAALKGGG